MTEEPKKQEETVASVVEEQEAIMRRAIEDLEKDAPKMSVEDLVAVIDVSLVLIGGAKASISVAREELESRGVVTKIVNMDQLERLLELSEAVAEWVKDDEPCTYPRCAKPEVEA